MHLRKDLLAPFVAISLVALCIRLGATIATADPPDGAAAGGWSTEPHLGLPLAVAELSELPAIPGCEDLLTAARWEELKNQLVDPGVLFEEWRKEAGTMIPSSALDACEHKAWTMLHGARSEGASGNEAGALLEGLEESPLSAAISENIPLPWDGDSGGINYAQRETAIAVDPVTFVRAVAGANSLFRDSNCDPPIGGHAANVATLALYATTNGGGTWTYACAPWPAGTPTFCGDDTDCDFTFADPAVAWDTNGNGYAVYLIVANCAGCPSSSRAVILAKYNPTTSSWSPVGYVVNKFADNTRVPDKPFLKIDTSSVPNRFYVTWAEFTSDSTQSNQLVAYSDTGTTGSWTTRTLDSPTGKTNFGILTTGSTGKVYAVWARWSQSNPEVSYFSKSTNRGLTWSTPVAIFTHNVNLGVCVIPPQNTRGLNPQGVIDIDNTTAFPGRLYFVTNDIASPSGQCPANYCAEPPGGDRVHVYLIYSTDDGATWSSRGAPVNDDDPLALNYHFFPWAAVDQTDGTLNVAWYDSRNSVSFGHNRYAVQVFYTRSSSGGTSFEPNTVLTDSGANFASNVPFLEESTCQGTGADQTQFGEYLGLAAANRTVWQATTDSRNMYPTSNGNREDAASSTLVNCSPPAWDALAPGLACDRLSWNPVNFVGTNATSVTYYVYRSTTAGCSGRVLLNPGGTSSTTFTDSTGMQGTNYYYQVDAVNNCPGTTLTPFRVSSACSGALFYKNPISAAVTSLTPAVCASSTGNKASASVAPAGSTYSWSITNGTITAGATSQVVTYTALSSGLVGLTVTASFDGCQDTKSLNVPIRQTLTSTSIALAGSASVCTGGSGGTATVTDPPGQGVLIAHQWGYRTIPNGAITDILGQTGTTYLVKAADFSGPGTFKLVCKSTPLQCGSQKVSNEVSITVTASTAPATPVVTAPASAPAGMTNLTASVPFVSGVTYAWSVTNGMIMAGQGTRQITFTAGSAGQTMTIQVFEALGGCTSAPGIAKTQVDFSDVPPSNPVHDFVNIIAKNGITSGCGGANYCPDANITRAQMSVFLLRAKHGAGYTPPLCTANGGFTDVACPSQYADWIGQLSAEGITSGCGGGNFCPNYSVDRQSMAPFLLKARYTSSYTPPACTGIFADVPCPGPPFADWIEDLYNKGITAGCGGGPLPAPIYYCPYTPVTRGSMAVFIAKTWGLQ